MTNIQVKKNKTETLGENDSENESKAEISSHTHQGSNYRKYTNPENNLKMEEQTIYTQ